MKLKDIMSTEVEIVPPDASIQQAAAKMRSLDVGALPVCDGRRLVGMITDRDITIRATAEGRDPKNHCHPGLPKLGADLRLRRPGP
jgi:CBS domain-containing protein